MQKNETILSAKKFVMFDKFVTFASISQSIKLQQYDYRCF